MEPHAPVTECTHCEHYHELVKRIDELESHYKKRMGDLESHYKKIIEDLERKYQQKIENLERRLSYYENAHSPPSRDSLFWKQQKKERRTGSPSKPGQKPGHAGATHNLRPTSTVKHTASRCSRCGSTNIEETTHDNRIIAEIPKPQPHTVTQHIIQSYICRNCGCTTTADADMPEKGDLGSNLVGIILLLWAVRLPLKKIAKTIELLYSLRLSAACINSALCNVSDAVRPVVDEIKKDVRGSSVVNFDETSYPINGNTGWVWVATTDRSCFVSVEAGRGAYVLQKHFDGFCGVAVSDGWYAYNMFGMRQRCWAHILREAKHMSERTKSDTASSLYGALCDIFRDAKSGLECSPAPNHSLYRHMMSRLEKIISAHGSDWQLCKFMTKLENAKDSLFTFLLHPGVPPTNNAAEQALRESVIHRKIRGLVRNEKGMRMFGNLMTCIMTWNLRGCNILDEVVKYI